MEADTNFFKISHQNIEPKQGMILVAEPGLDDPYFKRSIVLVVEHGESGSMGFVLNKLLDNNISDMVEEFPPNDIALMLGGPVGIDSLHFIHTLGDIIPDAIHICHSIYWGGDFEVLKKLFASKKIKDNQVKFFIGHAGWVRGQLLEELSQESWVLVNISEPDIMNNGTDLWRKVVGQLGNNYRTWMNYPEDPHLN